MGFLDFLSAQESIEACDRGVVVWRAGTGRLVGGEKAFRKEVLAKYGLECDVAFGALRAMARENADQCEAVAAAKAARALAQPLLLALVGPAGSGKSTVARRLAAQYGLVRVSSGDMLRRIASGAPAWGPADGDADGSDGSDAATPSSIPTLSAEEVDSVRECLRTGELVPEGVLLRLVRARLAEADVRAHGAVLDGLPRTAAQASVLRDLEPSLGSLAALLQLEGLGPESLAERVRGRRVDPTSGEIYHATLALPPSALVLSRLAVRPHDVEGSIPAQLRHHAQHAEDVSAAYRGITRAVDAQGSSQEVFARVRAVVEPLLAAVAARKLQAASLATKESGAIAASASPAPSPALAPHPAQHTPGSIAFTVAPELPSSRRGSLMQPLSTASAAAPAAAAASSSVLGATSSSSRAGSRRSSGTGADPRAIAQALLRGGASGSRRASSSRPGSKPASREGLHQPRRAWRGTGGACCAWGSGVGVGRASCGGGRCARRRHPQPAHQQPPQRTPEWPGSSGPRGEPQRLGGRGQLGRGRLGQARQRNQGD
jgi:adenylate kinase